MLLLGRIAAVAKCSPLLHME